MAFRRHFVLLVQVPPGSCYKLVVMVVLHDALCFTDMDDLEARGGGYSHTLPIRVCAAQRGRDFEAPDLEWGIHFRRVF